MTVLADKVLDVRRATLEGAQDRVGEHGVGCHEPLRIGAPQTRRHSSKVGSSIFRKTSMRVSCAMMKLAMANACVFMPAGTRLIVRHLTMLRVALLTGKRRSVEGECT